MLNERVGMCMIFTQQADASRWFCGIFTKGANLLHLGITMSERAGCGLCSFSAKAPLLDHNRVTLTL